MVSLTKIRLSAEMLFPRTSSFELADTSAHPPRHGGGNANARRPRTLLQFFPQPFQRDLLIPKLASLILVGHNDSRGPVANPYRCLTSIDVLSTRPTGAKCFDVAFGEKRLVGLRHAITCQERLLRLTSIWSLWPTHLKVVVPVSAAKIHRNCTHPHAMGR